AIENIIVNAVDVMSGGGSLRVEVALTLIEEKPHVTVKIKDTGQGMDEELMEKIFEPFFSTKAAKGGAGLGLPISKKIMEEHGGSISVESSPGQGSTFLLNFPAPTP
ncbi:MAG: HAMP domain-containing sensor histidine kinase, partial [Nitrospiraceae bacterium]|nr:HAMP domain-containing sensor histidine kinase [Nitrospiraceae bacterium]